MSRHVTSWLPDLKPRTKDAAIVVLVTLGMLATVLTVYQSLILTQRHKDTKANPFQLNRSDSSEKSGFYSNSETSQLIEL